MYRPPFTLEPRHLEDVAAIAQLVGRFEGLSAPRPQPLLRKENRVRTVQGSVAIEGNTLSLDQVTAVLDGKRVSAPRREILEVQNAIAAYDEAPRLRPWSEKDLLRGHRLIMANLAADAGRWRQIAVGVFQGSRVAHVAPPAKQVPRLMGQLLDWGKADAKMPSILKACLAHYEIQFIHPFSDGNGRVGRLWQHVILLSVSPVFEFVPFESVIRARQKAYYDALARSDRDGDTAPFAAFALEALREALARTLDALRAEPVDGESRLDLAKGHFARAWFARGDYLRLHKRLSTASASRDLASGLAGGALERQGDKRLARYRFVTR
jgi:Fic family protein